MCASEICGRSARTSSPGNRKQLPRNVEGLSCYCSTFQGKDGICLLASLGCSGYDTQFPQEGTKIKSTSCELTVWSSGAVCPHVTGILQPNSLAERFPDAPLKVWRAERMGSSFPGSRNAFHLPPAELGFSLGTKKTVHGVFLFINISS